MKQEFYVMGDVEIMREFEALFDKHNLSVVMANETVKASEGKHKGASHVITGTAKAILLALIEALTKKPQFQIELSTSEATEIMTCKDSPDKFEQRITKRSDVMFKFLVKL